MELATDSGSGLGILAWRSYEEPLHPTLFRELIEKYDFLGDAFPKQLDLDSCFTSWDLKIRIPRRKLRIYSYSQV